MLILLSLFLVIALTTAIVQFFSALLPEETLSLRKFLHLVAICSCAAATAWYPQPLLLGWLFLGFTPVLFAVVYFKVLHISKGDSLGIALFPAAFGLLIISQKIEIQHIVTSMLLLAWSDALAGWAGSKYARQFYTPLFEKKSTLGSLVFLLSACVILALRYPVWQEHFAALLLVAVLATGVEMFSWRGSDNFTIPVLSAIGLEAWSRQQIHIPGIPALGIGLALLVLIRYKKWLNPEGTIAAGFMGLWILYFLGTPALALPGAFLLMGSLASRLNEKTREPDGRNAIQVFANGGAGMLVALLAPVSVQATIYFCYSMVFAIANADTLSSELGKYFKGKTIDILNGRSIIPGLSGGISAAGTWAGWLGSALMAHIALWIFPVSRAQAMGIALAGFAGMLTDSVLGSAFQAKYRQGTAITETGDAADLIRGWHGFDNDMVNIASIVLSLLVAWTAFSVLRV